MKLLLSLLLVANLRTEPSSESFSRLELYTYILDCAIEQPEIVYKQAVLETGHFTSYSFQMRKNLFGFRSSKGYIVYKTWKESVEHYAKWQRSRYNGEDYYMFLNNIGYAEDTTYVDKLRQIKFKL